MADSKVVSLRVPDELYLQLEAIAEDKYPLRGKQGGNKSQVLLDALIAYLNTVDTVDTVDEKMSTTEIIEIWTSVKEVIAPLQQRIDQLEQQLGELVA